MEQTYNIVRDPSYKRHLDKSFPSWVERQFPLFKFNQVESLGKWHLARALFTSNSCTNVRKMSQGLAMASELINSTCDASLDLVEAKWLCSVFTDSVTGVLTPPNSTRKAFDTFMSLIDSPDDSCKMRALCYAGIVYYNCQIRKNLVLRSATMGYSFAQDKLIHSWRTLAGDALPVFQRNALEQLEPNAFKSRISDEVTVNGLHSIDCYYLVKLATLLSHEYGMQLYGDYFGFRDPERYHWYGTAAKWCFLLYKSCYITRKLLTELEDHFDCKQLDMKVIYKIGEMLNGHVKMHNQSIFGVYNDSRTRLFDYAQRAVMIYNSQNKQANAAIRAWITISPKLRVHKDVIPIISSYIWAGRTDAEYQMTPRRGPPRKAKKIKT